MGDFRIQIDAVGGHGCQREVKDGDVVYGCGLMSCPDCLTARFVEDMKRIGTSVKKATLTHWPGQPHQVVDEFDSISGGYRTLAPRIRSGSF